MIAELLIGLCAVGVAGVLVADLSGIRLIEWIGKPLAALSFIVAAWHWGALDSIYGQWILAGLIFGALGDVLLIPKGAGPAFLGGMIAFLLGHLLFAVAFWTLPLHGPTMLAVALFMAITAWPLLRWMMPGVPAGLRLPVMAYQLVIALMLVLAWGAWMAGAHWSLMVAASAFTLSDLSVARNRFVSAGFVNRAWGIPLYFAAQMLMASTVARV